MMHNRSIMSFAWKCDVDPSYPGEIASREHWVEERANRGARIAKKALASAKFDQVEELSEFDSECLRQAKVFVAKISFALTHTTSHTKFVPWPQPLSQPKEAVCAWAALPYRPPSRSRQSLTSMPRERLLIAGMTPRD